MLIDADGANPADAGSYQVVARKYRPQSFEQLVGQPHIGQGLSSAITTNRVGHAYLFTGARGTGKTSTARIFAKALNCKQGPTPSPCKVCDICQSVTSGDDLDVIEIDAASNRGIDEIRQLRANASKTPSRARFKIYIIDEVHMLTRESFNALLKTLEEPPAHVKFILCTTDPEKIPITVLSRCQRFDFSPVSTEEIKGRLAEIAQNEGVEIEPAALQMVARRAAGSMRDSQSLLEQLLSVSQGRVTVDAVNRMLGTAQSGRLGELVTAIVARDARTALECVDAALRERADVGQLAEQMMEHLRDMLAAALGASREILLASSPDSYDELVAAGKGLGIETMLATIQILDHALVRMRQSIHPRVLLEVALVRICQLESLDDLATVIGQLQAGGSGPVSGGAGPRPAASMTASISPPTAAASPAQRPPAGGASSGHAAPQKKTEQLTESVPGSPLPAAGGTPLTPQNAANIWQQMVESLGDMTGDMVSQVSRVASSGPNRLVVSVPKAYIKEYCERPATRTRIEQALVALTGQFVKVEFETLAETARPAPIVPVAVNKRQLIKDRERHPLVEKTIEVFGAEIADVVETRRSPG